MSTVKISELTALTSADAADELVIVDDSAGVTKKITHANLANFGSGTVTAGALALGTGTVTAGAIDFSGLANAAGMTSEVLDDYEEGTWTPTVDKGTVSVADAFYTKIGRRVTVEAELSNFSDRSSATRIYVQSLPYMFSASFDNTTAGVVFGRWLDKDVHAVYTWLANGLTFWTTDSGNGDSLYYSDLNNASANVRFQATYNV